MPNLNPLAPLGDSQDIVLLDGGLATELEKRGADLEGALWSAKVLAEAPERIEAVHDAYLRAGADCLITATYQATVEGFARAGHTGAEAEALMVRAVDLAIASRDRHVSDSDDATRRRPLVAASVGPYGAFRADGSEYTGDYDLDQAELEAFHRERLALLAGAGADLLACETIPAAAEARALAGLLDALGPAAPRAWMSFTCRDTAHLSDGTPLAPLVAELELCPSLVAVGVNCVSPSLVPELVSTLRGATALPIVVYPNSGERWDARARLWRGTAEPHDFAEAAVSWVAAGASLVGGCCRTGPEHIQALRAELQGRERLD